MNATSAPQAAALAPAGERPPLLVVQIGPPEPLDRAPAAHRTLQPCRALGELADVTVVSAFTLSPAIYSEGLLLAADVLVLREVADPDLLPVVAARRRLGKLTACEIGSHVLAPSLGDDARTRQSDLVERSLIPQLARQADCLQLATAALDTQLASLSAHRAIFPSQLWDAPVAPPARRGDRVVVGWAGSRAERNDLLVALPALAGVLERHPEVRLAVMGDPELREALTALPPARLSFIPAGSLERYHRFLEGIDIGIAPLAPTLFNRCGEDLRFIDYAAHGVLAICADLDPYRDGVRPGLTGFLFRDAAELEAVLERALAEGELRAAIAARAASYALDRLERPHAAERLGFYLSVAAQLGLHLGGAAGPHRPFPPPRLADVRQAARLFSQSRYLALGAGTVERLLGEGLRHAGEGAVDEALRAFQAAERLAPDSHLPPLLLGMTARGPVAIEALGRAEARNPLSCQASFQLGERLLADGDRAGAATAFERAREIAPAFGAPQERLGALAEAAGRMDEACRLYEEAALQNGAFALPIARLASLALDSGRIDKAVGLLERSLVDDPDLGLTNLLLGRCYIELKRFHQARLHLLRAVDSAQDRAAVLTELARAEAGLGNAEAARETLEDARRET